MPKDVKKKKTKQIKQKQKQRQQISIVINSNNKSKRVATTKQTPQPQQPARNNPPVVNVMGDTRPQVSASGNFSGLGQQNRLFANDSALEQRLSRLLKFENDQSANSAPALSNTKLLTPEPTRERSPSPVKLKAPPKSEVMDLNFFNTRRKAYEDEQATLNNNDEEMKTPSLIEVAKGKWNNLFSANSNAMPPVGASITPAINLLDDINSEQSEIYEPATYTTEEEPFIPAGRKQWMKLKRAYKRDWAYDNQGVGSNMVQHSNDEIDMMQIRELNALYDQVMEARERVPTKRI